MGIDIQNIRKKEEFEAFIETIEQGARAHWVDIARAIGVNKDTITAWKRHPRSIRAISKGIQHALSEMERCGRNDWRMWLIKLKILGVDIDSKSTETSSQSGILPHITIDTMSR
ncbi:hypothetical protein COU89_03680 [Candidatus Roizmanbacteria bacterium CG10_big_fil_rev_8_21_14_0_10_45_7]|uniref:Uncharacterized protein n=1 Tax=Candidatus Roizmanbacteria bacterium CG10_big_fil_rev_8_21_14_0_10_45_7 TaxID=1974854 RepID=A0A2M8KTV5_9BACT|nr:MAG: hypothetical protein COU89_03680 [Candidatus Roizmanbacteria bacterium CG10_big_fil_rev_8_21_14_0_10_45_7]